MDNGGGGGGRSRGGGGGRGRFFNRGRFRWNWAKRGARGRGRGRGDQGQGPNESENLDRNNDENSNDSSTSAPSRGNSSRSRPYRNRGGTAERRPPRGPGSGSGSSDSRAAVHNNNNDVRRLNGSDSNSSGSETNDHAGSGSGPVQNKKRRRRTRIDTLLRSQWIKKYPGYAMYFPSQPNISDLDKKIEACKEFLLKNGCGDEASILKIEENQFYDLKFDNIVNDEVFMESWPDFAADLEDNCEEVSSVWGLSVYQIVVETVSRKSSENAPPSLLDENGVPIVPLDTSLVDVSYIRTGVLRVDPLVPFKNIKASLLGKFITVRGAIVRTGIFKPLCTRQTFQCNHCLHKFVVDQPEGRFTPPRSCPGPGPGQGQRQSAGGDDDDDSGCQNKKDFEPLLSARTNKIIDYRKIRLQDVEHSHLEHGRIPRTVDCDLYYDLANQCNAGDVITLCGVVKMSKENSGGHYGTEQSLHNLYIQVIALKNHKDSDRTMGGNWFSFSNKDYYAVKEIFESEKLFRLLVASLCPSIYGHELVKAGILLSLFSGTAHNDGALARRCDINILVVGDPGLGKSQMLKVVSEVAPRGVYICGTGSTTAGLTVTLVREGDEFSLEAGALVMADRGVCCIDEFDKMHSQHNALLEAMEQQSISIAKAGVFRIIPARTSVIAAANPVGGHYDNTKTVNENIKISAPLLSRFDLVFILQDRPNKKHDRSIVEHVTGFRQHNAIPSHVASSSQRSSSGLGVSSQNINNDSTSDSEKPLIERLKYSQGETIDLIPHPLLRKFIAYAKQYVHPKISSEAASVLKKYYMNLRKNHRHVDATPVTTRQLESLIRLTEARAKIELREIATSEDAQEILEIFDYCANGVLDDDRDVTLGFTQDIINSSLLSLNASITPGAVRSMTKNMAKRLLAKFEQVANTSGKTLFTEHEIKGLANSIGIDSNIDRLITSLNNDGYLIKKGPKTYNFECA